MNLGVADKLLTDNTLVGVGNELVIVNCGIISTGTQASLPHGPGVLQGSLPQAFSWCIVVQVVALERKKIPLGYFHLEDNKSRLKSGPK